MLWSMLWVQEKIQWQAPNPAPGHGIVFRGERSLRVISQGGSGEGVWVAYAPVGEGGAGSGQLQVG